MNGMFDYTEFSEFKHHLRDFLVQTKQFASQDNAELFADEVQAKKQVRSNFLFLIQMERYMY